METQIRPALTQDGWREKHSAGIAFNRTNDVARVTVRYNDGQCVTVTGADNLWRLIAFANDALPDVDVRKITREDVHVLHALAASIEVRDADLLRILPLVDALCEKVGALMLHR
jgi:hypothetical protein